MDTSATPNSGIEPQKAGIAIKVFGVGSAGINVMEQMVTRGCSAMTFAAINTDSRNLAKSSATEKIHLEIKMLRGLGTGGDPERGVAAAEENAEKLKAACAGADVIFILAGLGGGAGTGITPVLARVAKETGALVLGFVTTPFDCEGRRRQTLARLGLEALKAAADGVICLPNQMVCKLIDENTSVVDTFRITNELLGDGLVGVWRLLTQPSLIEIHFADVCALFRDRHAESFFAFAEAMGPTRSREAMDKLLAHPMLAAGEMLAESETALVSLMGGPDLTMAEINRVMEHLQRHCEHAQVIMGAAVDESFRDRLAITLIASRKSHDPHAELTEPPAKTEELDTQLLTRTATARPGSRFVPPPPDLPPEQVEQLLKRRAPGSPRPRRNPLKMLQAQLPLEIVSKGRFDKSEPTIHAGEDLDVPTYIRRGVALN